MALTSSRHALPLNCEALESRANPAGNVAAGIGADDVLYVRGDAADNLFSIQQNAQGDLVIIGVSGTTINGQSSVYLGRGALNGVQVLSDAGNDLVEMIGVTTGGTVHVQTGDEFDGVALYGVQVGNLIVRAEGGDDVIVTDGVRVANYAEIDGGNGFDTIDYRNYGISAPFLYLPNIESQVANPNPYPWN